MLQDLPITGVCVCKVKKSSIPENFDIRRDRVHQRTERRSSGRLPSSKELSRSRRTEVQPSRRTDDNRRGGRYETTDRRMGTAGNDYRDNIGLVVTRNRVDIGDGRAR